MKIIAISANLGNYDKTVPWVRQQLGGQGWELTIVRLDDSSFPPRPLAMTSRLQSGIPKMFGWQMYPGYDYYIWVDSAYALSNSVSVAWFVEKCQGYDMALCLHPERKTIKQEYEFVKKQLGKGNQYLTSRYKDEWLEEQYQYVALDNHYTDDRLYASTAFVYRDFPHVRQMMWAWWAHKARYLLHDQIILPYLVHEFGVRVKGIRENIYENPYFTNIRRGYIG